MGDVRAGGRVASMRPPHECGGKRVGARRQGDAPAASMRPPHECGGKHAVLEVVNMIEELLQ